VRLRLGELKKEKELETGADPGPGSEAVPARPSEATAGPRPVSA
jgi:hypothetical protein